MLLKNRIGEIKSILKSGQVLTSEEECYCYGTDAINLKHPAKSPDVVVFVETTEDVQNIVRYAYLHEIPIISRGAGTNMVGACLCPEGGIVLNFSKMNKILDIDTESMTARVQPGVVLADLKSNAEAEGLFYPPDPSNYKVSTVGGSIAQSSGGAMSLKYGTTKDYVLSLKVVTSDGKLMTLGAETTKDAVGYHLQQLIVGSEGTLAVVVEAVLKLIPKPQSRCAVSAYFNNVENAAEAVNEINLSGILPSAVDYMDNNSIVTVEDYAKCGLKTEYDCMLLFDIDGNPAGIAEDVKTIKSILEKYNAEFISVSNNEEQYDKIWSARRTSYSASSRLAPDVLSDDIIVPRRNIVEMIEFCKNTCSKYDLKMCLIGHLGDGNLHPQIVLNTEDEREFKNYIDAKSEIYGKAISLGGTISAEHGVGIEKLSYIENSIDKSSVEYMKMIKKILDPKNILNPGKIFI